MTTPPKKPDATNDDKAKEQEELRRRNMRAYARASGVIGIGWAMFGIAVYYGLVVKGKDKDTPPPAPAIEEQSIAPIQQPATPPRISPPQP